MGMREGLFQLLRSSADLGAALAAGAATTGTGPIPGPVALCAVGFAAAFILVRDKLTAKEQAAAEDHLQTRLAELIKQERDLERALKLLAAEANVKESVDRERSARLLRLVRAGNAEIIERLAEQDQLIIHIGRWLEQWCLAHDQDAERMIAELEGIAAKLDAIHTDVRETAATVKEMRRELGELTDEVRRCGQRLAGTVQLISNVPRVPGRYVERKQLLEKLAGTINGDGRAQVSGQAVFSGDGGQGKTVLACAYAQEHEADYPGGRFLIACESGSILERLAALWQAPAEAKLSDDQRAAAVLAKLSQAPRALLILDNFEGDAAWKELRERGLLPSWPCHILITSRAERLAGVQRVDVGRLSEEEAMALLAKYRPSALEARHRTAVKQIIAEVEGLAAAVAAIGAIKVLDEDDDWSGYAERLRTAPLAELPDAHEPVRQETGYPRKTLTVLDDLRRRLHPAEVRVLDYAALLPADQIVPHWLEALLESDAGDPQEPLALDLGSMTDGTPRQPAHVIRHLQQLDLLGLSDSAGELCRLHRLHRRRAGELLSERPEYRAALLQRLCRLAELRGRASHEAVTDASLRFELTPLAALSGTLLQAGRAPAAASLANWLMKPLQEMGRYRENLDLLGRFFTTPATLETLPPEETAQLLCHLGVVHQSLGQFAQAEPLMRRALAIDEHSFGPDHPNVAAVLNNLARLLQDTNRLTDAEPLMRRALAIDEHSFGPDHPNVARDLNNLAGLLQATNRLTDAEPLMRRHLAIFHQFGLATGHEHPHMRAAINNYGQLLKAMGLADEQIVARIKEVLRPPAP